MTGISTISGDDFLAHLTQSIKQVINDVCQIRPDLEAIWLSKDSSYDANKDYHDNIKIGPPPF